jgi:hypothetical protein
MLRGEGCDRVAEEEGVKRGEDVYRTATVSQLFESNKSTRATHQLLCARCFNRSLQSL